MTIENIGLDAIKPYEKNARTHPKRQIQLLADNITRFGFTTPVLIDKDNNLIAGHGRLEAVKQLGWSDIPAVRLENLSPKEVKALRLADNQLAQMSEWDMDLVIEELKDLDIDLQELTGFDRDLLENKYDDYQTGSIADRFLVAPFSVLDTRRGEWQARKKKWLELGIDSEVGRPDNLLGKGLTTLSKKQNTTYKSGVGLTGTSIFDPVLCELMYLWFAPTAAKVVDPFAGGSVRGVVAAKLGHQYCGTELRTEQVEANRAQATEITPDLSPVWVADDAMNIKHHFGEIQFDMLLTCPPYADLEVYSDDPRDISNMSYEDFKGAYNEIIKRSTELLKPNTFAVCVVGEVRAKNGEYLNFVGDTIKAFEEAGLHYYNEIVLVNMVGTLGLRITKQFSSGRKIGKTHQNVLVFWKGNPTDVKKTVESWAIKGDIFAEPIDESTE